MSSSNPHQNPPVDEHDGSEPEMIDEDEIAEVAADDDGDVAMDSDDEAHDHEQEEIHLQNDSIAYFDSHKDSVFAIAQHPTQPSLVATGGSEGETDDAPGKGYVFDTSAAPSRPVLPASYSGDQQPQNTRLEPVFEIDGHTDSINALTFTLPNGEFLLSGGMDGQLRAYAVDLHSGKPEITFLSSSSEVSEINWLIPCPSPSNPNTIALGASDGSVWVYTLDKSDPANALQIVQSYFLHTGPCTAGAWTPDGSLLATVSEDGSLYVYDVFGLASARGLATENGQTVVGLTDADQRFAVEGGLYSVAVNPTGAFVAVGGAGGAIKVVSLPRVSEPAAPAAAGKGRGAPAARRGGAAAAASPQAGTILASLGVQSDGIETLAFAPAPNNLLAAGSVDGSIAVYDAGRGFAVRKHIRGAHDEFSTVKVDFVRGAAGPAAGWLLTSCGMDGVVRRWDLRGATPGTGADAGAGLVKEWRGHRGDGEGGGVLGFMQGETGERVVTAGDDGVVLVFEA